MTDDYSAAHSMDSCWFAVDKDGHVAYFGTGEAGALPFDATLENPDALLDEIGRLIPVGESIQELVGRIPPGPLGTGGEHCMVRMGPDDQVLCFLASLEPVRFELARGTAVEVPAHATRAVILRNPSKALIKRLHTMGACLGCFYHWDHDEVGSPRHPVPAQHGLFFYGHLNGNIFSSPYGLTERPRFPLHIDQLPAALRHELNAFELPGLCFAQTPHIQPIDHDLCSSWEPAYLTLDGLRIRENRRAIASGFAPDTYAEFYDSLANPPSDWLKGITIDPPTSSKEGELT